MVKTNIKEINIYFINSPLQLLCAIEATYKFKLQNNILVVFNKGEGRNFFQIEKVLEKYPNLFNKVEFIDRELKTTIGWSDGFKKMEVLIKKYPVAENIFVGDFSSGLVRHFCNSTESKQVFIIDDGFATIRTAKQLENEEYFNNKEYIKKLISGFKYKFKKPSNLAFFTIFDRYIKHSKVIPNEMRSIEGIKKYNDIVYWIGSPIVEDGIVSLDYYCTSIIENCRKLNKKIVYIPHRRESIEKIDKIKEEVGFTIKNIDYPIELFFLLEKEAPNTVVSFFSTALFTLKKIMKNTRIFYIPIEDKNILSRKKHIQDIYHILESEVENFSVSNID